jgi:hypothetical protein
MAYKPYHLPAFRQVSYGLIDGLSIAFVEVVDGFYPGMRERGGLGDEVSRMPRPNRRAGKNPIRSIAFFEKALSLRQRLPDPPTG